ncbi:MAG: putative family carrier/transport protein [Planctomycetaceae bacterium]|nr:putative family carrier/transport protein [Planctomycetaceae bacterium]
MSYGQTYANDLFAIDASESARAAFMRRTYLHLFGAILAFIGIEAVFFQVLPVNEVMQTLFGRGAGGIIVLMVAFMVAGWLAQYWAHNSTSRVMQYLGLALYTVTEAVIFLPILYIASKLDQNGANIIPTAGIITMLIFGGLTTIVLLTGADFSFLRVGLMVAGWAALVIAIASIFMGFSLGLMFAGAMIVLACGYILYDTSNVLHHYRTDQHVGAALELFASVALLFYYVLRILIQLYGAANND